MSKNAPSEATTPAASDIDTVSAMIPDDATTPIVTPINASIPAGQKSPALDHPSEWLGTRSIAVSPDGVEYAFLGNNGTIYQGFTLTASASARAFGYAFGMKQKADSDGAKDKSLTDETALRLIAPEADILAWCPPRVSGPREETATALDLQIKTLLIAKLKPTKNPDTGKLMWDTLNTAVKEKKIKLTGFSGGAAHLFTRYFDVVKVALDMEPTAEQRDGFTTRTIATAEKALIEAAKRQANAGVDASPFA